jgi:hypothetical protein
MDLTHIERLRWIGELARINTTLNEMAGRTEF